MSSTIAFRFLTWLLLASMVLAGCAHSDPDEPWPVLADDDPVYAKRLGLGRELELTQVGTASRNGETVALQFVRPVSPKQSALYLGKLPVGTRLRVEHVWATGTGWAWQTLRVLPDHGSIRLPIMPGDLPLSFPPVGDGDGFAAYAIPLEAFRLVPPEERTPEDQIKPLSRRQEWPRGWRR